MTLTPMETLGIILAVAAGTQLTRWLPFWLFPEKKQPPAVVTYLGRVLPPAMMGLLVVYCLRNVSWLSVPHGAPELIAIAAVTALHTWGIFGKHPNMLDLQYEEQKGMTRIWKARCRT